MVMSSPVAGAVMLHFFYRPTQMLFGQLGLGELAGRLDDDLRADRRPVKFGGIFLGEDLDLLAIDADGIGAGGNLVRKVAKDGIVLQQMGERLGISEIVDGDEFQAGIVQRGAKNIAANATKTVNANFNCHMTSSQISM